MKRDKTVIGRCALSFTVVALTLAFGSCTQEPISPSMAGGDGMEVRVTFPGSVVTRATTGGTEGGTSNENRLDRVTILVFNQDGTKLETVLSEDVTASNSSLATSQPKWASDGTLMVSPLQNPSQPKKIYAVANWSTTVFDKDTYTEAKLKDELTTIASVADINGAGVYPMLMSGSKAVASLSSAFYNVTVDMERQVSKIRALFSIPIAVQNYLPQIEWQTELMKITVVNVPNKSYIVGRGAAPTGSTLLNSLPLTVDDVKPAADNQTVPATEELKWSESVYINENPIIGNTDDNKNASTCIVVQLPYKNRTTGMVEMDNYYQLYINDTRDAASPYKVLRNTIYTLNISIKGIGLPVNKLVPDVNIDDQLTVIPWEKGEMGDVEEAPNHFFNIDRTQIGFQSFETSFRSSIVTDVLDWKLVKADGTTLFSFAEGKTTSVAIDGVTYTLSGIASAATITVSRVAGATDFPINRMIFIAKNLKVPFTVAYDNGFIPNSVLTAAGWPTDKLPPTGLQIAKRGDKVPPGGVAGDADSEMNWGVLGISVSGLELGLGMGVSNTVVMTGADCPPAQYCRDMGTGWFLPSRNELKVISDNEAILGDSYLFSKNFYQSSSQSTSGVGLNECWIYSIYYSSAAYGLKSDSHDVRCVKAI